MSPVRVWCVTSLCFYVQVDLFFYREPEEAKPEDEDEVAPQAEFGLPAPEYGVDQWTTAAIPDAAWPGEAQAPISAAPAAASWNDSTGEFSTDLASLDMSQATILILTVCFFFAVAPAAEGGWDTAVPPTTAAAGWE